MCFHVLAASRVRNVSQIEQHCNVFHCYAVVQFGLSHQQSSSGMCFHGYAACIVRTDSPTEEVWDLFPRLRCMYISACLTNRVALVYVFTATLHIQFQRSSSRMYFHGYAASTFRTVSPTKQLWDVSPATLHVQFGLSHQQSSSGLCFHGYAACTVGSNSGICFDGYAACTVLTASPTEQLWDVFPRLPACSCTDLLVRQSELYVNRAALGCVSMAVLHVQVGLSR